MKGAGMASDEERHGTARELQEPRGLSLPEVACVVCCMLLPVVLIGMAVGFRLGVGTHYDDEEMARLALVEEFHCCSCGDSFLAEVGTYCPECGSRAAGSRHER